MIYSRKCPQVHSLPVPRKCSYALLTLRRVIHEPEGIHRDEHAAYHVIDARLRHLAARDRVLKQFVVENADLELLVQSRKGRLDGAVRGA